MNETQNAEKCRNPRIAGVCDGNHRICNCGCVHHPDLGKVQNGAAMIYGARVDRSQVDNSHAIDCYPGAMLDSSVKIIMFNAMRQKNNKLKKQNKMANSHGVASTKNVTGKCAS